MVWSSQVVRRDAVTVLKRSSTLWRIPVTLSNDKLSLNNAVTLTDNGPSAGAHGRTVSTTVSAYFGPGVGGCGKS